MSCYWLVECVARIGPWEVLTETKGSGLGGAGLGLLKTLDPKHRSVNFKTVKMAERSLVMVKPDGVQRCLVGEVVRRFEQKGYKIVAIKFKKQSEDFYKNQYKALESLPFYAGLCKFMSSGPAAAFVLEGSGVVKEVRKMMGETNPADSQPGSIRGDYSVSISRNVLHASDSLETAKREIPLWFDASEIVDWSGNPFVSE